MTQEDKTTEQDIERIARLHLKERYKDTKVLWSLINEDFRITHDDFELPCEDHMFLAIALRILDRLENIEKLLQPVETPMDSVRRTLISRNGE